MINITSVTYNSFGLTDIGRRREENQDAFLIDDEINLYLVADGLGGLDYGKEASEYAVKHLSLFIKAGLENLTEKDEKSISELLESAIYDTDEGVRRRLGDNSATTIVVVLIQADKIYITHVGDSRAYLFMEGKLHGITEDHNIANQYVRKGLLTKEEARSHPTQSMLTNSVGIMNETEDGITITILKPENNMRILMCSDGLTGMLSELEIGNLLTIEPSTEIAVKKLINGANHSGGLDNITAVVIDVIVQKTVAK